MLFVLFHLLHVLILSNELNIFLGAGVHVIATDQGDEVAEIFQAASEGKSSGSNRKCPITKRSKCNITYF